MVLSTNTIAALRRIYGAFGAGDLAAEHPETALTLLLEEVARGVQPVLACRQTLVWPAMNVAAHKLRSAAGKRAA